MNTLNGILLEALTFPWLAIPLGAGLALAWFVRRRSSPVQGALTENWA